MLQEPPKLSVGDEERLCALRVHASYCAREVEIVIKIARAVLLAVAEKMTVPQHEAAAAVCCKKRVGKRGLLRCPPECAALPAATLSGWLVDAIRAGLECVGDQRPKGLFARVTFTQSISSHLPGDLEPLAAEISDAIVTATDAIEEWEVELPEGERESGGEDAEGVKDLITMALLTSRRTWRLANSSRSGEKS